MTKLSISFKTSTKMTNLKHNNRDLTEEEYSLKAHEHIQRENSKYNIEIIKGNLEDSYKKIFNKALQEYNEKQKRNDRKIKDYLSHIKKSKKYDVQREFILAVGDKKTFENHNINFKVNFAEKILKPMVQDFIKNNPNLYVYNAVIHLDEIGAPHAHINVIPVAKGYKKGLEIQPSFKKALNNQGYTEKGKHQYKQFREKQVQIFEKHLNNYNLQRKVVGTNSIKDVREYKKIMTEIDKEALNYKKAKFEEIRVELDVYKDEEYKNTLDYINELKTAEKNLLRENRELRYEIYELKDRKDILLNDIKKHQHTIQEFDNTIKSKIQLVKMFQDEKLKLENELEIKKDEFEVLRDELDVYREKTIKSTKEENKRLIDTLKSEIRELENRTIDKINNIIVKDEDYLEYKKDIMFVKEMTGNNIKGLVLDNLIKENNISKYKLIINKAKEIFKDVSVFNAMTKAKEFLGIIKKVSFVSSFKELNIKYQTKFDETYRSIYPQLSPLQEKIERYKEQERLSLQRLLQHKDKEIHKDKTVERGYGLER